MQPINEFLDKINKKIIFCDMDGVLTNFLQAVEDLGQGTFEELEKKDESLPWKIIAKSGEEFWSQMEWLPDGKELWEFIKPYHPTILSAPTKNSKVCISGKIKWVHRELGPHVKLILAPAKEKMEYAHKHGILIDDVSLNCQQWESAGGISILHKSTYKTINELTKILKD